MTSLRTFKNYFTQIMVFRREGSVLVIFEIFIPFVESPLLKWKFQIDLESSGPQMMKQSGRNCPTIYGWPSEWINWGGYSIAWRSLSVNLLKFQSEQQMESEEYSWLQKGADFFPILKTSHFEVKMAQFPIFDKSWKLSYWCSIWIRIWKSRRIQIILHTVKSTLVKYSFWWVLIKLSTHLATNDLECVFPVLLDQLHTFFYEVLVQKLSLFVIKWSYCWAVWGFKDFSYESYQIYATQILSPCSGLEFSFS